MAGTASTIALVAPFPLPVPPAAESPPDVGPEVDFFPGTGVLVGAAELGAMHLDELARK
ncbi:hypothetical protein HK104_005415, partial [Borealophlyctis nickersoniae]